jgi:carbohydrate diacid regulator
MVRRTVLLVRFHELSVQKDFQKMTELKLQIINKMRGIMPDNGIMIFTGEKLLFLCLPFVGEDKTVEKTFAEKILRAFEHSGLRVCIGIGERLEGIDGYRESYLQAKQSIHLLLQLMKGKGMSHIDDWGIVRLMDSIPNKIRQRFAGHYEAFLLHLSKEQEETLEAFLESDLNVKDAAERLHLHRNTLLYRLDKLAEQIKLDPKKFNDAIIYKLLLICKRLSA